LYSEKSSDTIFDLVPIFHKESRSKHVKRSLSEKNPHMIVKRDVLNDEEDSLSYRFYNDYLSPDSSLSVLNRQNSNIRNKLLNESVVQQPITFYIECLIVTDISIYEQHSRFINSSDQDLVLNHMSIYYAHLIKGVNQRFMNSFENDTQLKIYAVLKNYLFLTVNNKKQKLKIA
jgi:hypothetical protein